MIKKLIIIALLSSPALAQTYTDCNGIAGTSLFGIVSCPQLPAGVTTAFNQKAVVNWTYPVQPGATAVTVSAGANAATNGTNLQNAINTAALNCGSIGYIINLPVGFTYTAQNSSPNSFRIPQNNCSAGHYVVVQSANLSSLLLQGTRVRRTDSVNMPTLTNNLGSGSNPVIFIGDAPSAVPQHWWFAGLEVINGFNCQAGCSTGVAQGYFVIGDACGIASGSGCPLTSSMTQANLASDIHLDRIYMHTNNCTGAATDDSLTFGVWGDASNVSMNDSIEDCVFATYSPNPAQSLLWAQDQTFGTVALVNNEMRGGTEVIGFGFSQSPLTNAKPVPSDIYIGQNYIHKWNTSLWQTSTNQRNWIECKSCQRLLAEGNYFDTDRGNSVSAAFQFTPRNSSGVGGVGGCTWCVVQDITIRYNYAKNFSDFISILGANGNTSGGSTGPELPSKRFNVHDNVGENLDRSVYAGNGRWIQIAPGDASSVGCSGTPNTAQCQVSDIIITHNTFAGGTASNQSNTFWTFVGSSLPTTSKGYNLVITNNIAPAGANAFASDTGTAHPLSGTGSFLDSMFSSYTFDNNVITNIGPAGYSATSDFPSPICNFSKTASGCSTSNPGMQSSMSTVGFVAYNSGLGGDYHPCFANNVPPGCSGASPYASLASDGLGVTSKYSRSPGANTDAVNQLTSCAFTGQCTIQQMRVTGPYVGDYGENFQLVQLPGYNDARLGDGGGSKTNITPFFLGGYGYRWHDLSKDPAGSITVGGWDVGIMGMDYTTPTNGLCGFVSPLDNKQFFGTVQVLYANNVRALIDYFGPMNQGGVTTLTLLNLTQHQKFLIQRPGKVSERYSIDNNCGASPTFLLQPELNLEWTSFTGWASGGLAPSKQYPPTFGNSWDEGYWQHNACEGQTAVYNPCSPSPVRVVNFTGTIQGMMGLSTVAGEGCPTTQANCGNSGFPGGYSPGSTTLYAQWSSASTYIIGDHANFSGITYISTQNSNLNNEPDISPTQWTSQGTALAFPISAEFYEIAKEDSSAGQGSYRCAPAVGCRNNLQVTLSVPATPTTDSIVHHFLGWFGSLGIGNFANASLRQTEYLTPPSPTMNAGSSPTFSYDTDDWTMIADGTPKVDFTLTGTMYDPTFCVLGWNGSVPTVTINGVPQTANINYVPVVNPLAPDPCSSGLLLQIVNAPNIGNVGDVALTPSTRVVISGGTAPSGIPPYLGRQTVIFKGADDKQ